jgi:CBS domain-containing protein
MTSPAVTAPENTDAADLAETMVTRNVRSIPIVIGRSVVGIVGRRDLLRTLVRDDTAIAAQVRQRIETYTGALITWRIDVENGRVRITGPIADDDEQVLLILARTVPGVIDVGLHRTRTPAQG